MKKIVFLSAVIFNLFSCNFVYADDEKKACVKYQRSDYSWSQGYAVRGFTVSGSDLNNYARKNGYNSSYRNYGSYFIITWDNGGYIALDVGSNYLPSYEREVKDQNNRTWKIKEGWNWCD